MLELVTVRTGKFVKNIKKRKETHYSKWFIKPLSIVALRILVFALSL